jgi:hypothetical protein
MHFSEKSKIILSVSSNDLRCCLSVFDVGDIILTPYKPIERLYNKLGIPIIRNKYLYLRVLFSKYKQIYVFGQGPTFFILYFRNFLALFGKRVYFSDSHLMSEKRQISPNPTIGFEYVRTYFPRWLTKLVKFEPCYDGGFFWLESYTMMEPMVELKKTYNLHVDNFLIILDEVFIIDSNILDIPRLAARYKLLLKRKSRSSIIKIDPKILTFFKEHEDTIVPIELYSNYSAIIGNHSTALKMPRSISLFQITGFAYEAPTAYTPKTLHELYLHLNC